MNAIMVRIWCRTAPPGYRPERLPRKRRAAGGQLPSVAAIQLLTALKYSRALSGWFRSCGAALIELAVAM